MPWCDECTKFWNPSSMPADGASPQCGDLLDAPDPISRPEHSGERYDPTAGMGDDDIDTAIPWHFWVMVAALGLYLGWRLVQGVAWLAR